jgi:Family of unknown function (DUF5678)
LPPSWWHKSPLAKLKKSSNQNPAALEVVWPEQSACREVNKGGASQDSQNGSSGKMEMTQTRDQVDKNYEAFVAMLPNIIGLHRNKYALMKDGEVVGYYTTLEDAYMTANKFYPNEPYSVQKVTDVAVDLGFFSHAVSVR